MNTKLPNRKVITVDGLAGSGKTTLSKMLAEKLGYKHLNSGIFYRAAAHLVFNHLKKSEKSLDEDGFQVIEALKIIDGESGEKSFYIDDKIFTADLFADDISQKASLLSALPRIRELLLEKQQFYMPHNDLIAEGRDMGTVVFPGADLKFFVTADLEIRAKRRSIQLKNNQNSPKNSENELALRDERDIKRKIAPALAAKDAILIDNSSHPLTQVIEEMYHYASLKGLARTLKK